MSVPRVHLTNTATPTRKAVRYGTPSSFDSLGYVDRSAAGWQATLRCPYDGHLTTLVGQSSTRADAVSRIVKLSGL